MASREAGRGGIGVVVVEDGRRAGGDLGERVHGRVLPQFAALDSLIDHAPHGIDVDPELVPVVGKWIGSRLLWDSCQNWPIIVIPAKFISV